jgi:hypothetical protein
VNRSAPGQRRRLATGIATIELVVAMGILASVMLPLAFGFAQEQRLARGYYFRAVAMEIVDGEMEVLLAGEWRTYPKGQHSYHVRAEAAKNLPPGQFLLSIEGAQVRLEWRPGKPGQGGTVTRVGSLPVEPQGKAREK